MHHPVQILELQHPFHLPLGFLLFLFSDLMYFRVAMDCKVWMRIGKGLTQGQGVRQLFLEAIYEEQQTQEKNTTKTE